MGLFSGRKISVFTTNEPLMETNDRLLKDAVLQSILEGTPLSYGVANAVTGSMGVLIDRFRTYAKNHYTLGLPIGMSTTTITVNEADVADAITDSLSLPYGALVEWHNIMPLAGHNSVMPHLFTARGLSPHNNAITIYPPGLVEQVPETENSYPVIITRVQVSNLFLDATDPTFVNILYEINSVRSIGPAEEKVITESRPVTYFTEVFQINDAFLIDHVYCVAQYYALDAAGETAETADWWFYNVDTGTYPAISLQYDTDTQANFLPVIPLRYENESMTRDELHDTELYKTSKALLKKLNIDFDLLGSELESNPNIADIDHAYVMFGIDLQTDNQACLAYLTEYFDYLHETSSINRWDIIDQYQQNDPKQTNQFVFNRLGAEAPSGYHKTEYETQFLVPGKTKDEYDSRTTQTAIINHTVASNLLVHGLDTSIYFSHVTSKLVNGTIGDGKIGAATVEKTLVADQSSYSSITKYILSPLVDMSSITFRHQITAGVYKEVTVYGLLHRNYIYGDHGIFTSLSTVIDDPENHNFIIPLHYSVAKRLSWKQQHSLYQESLRIVINAYEITKLKWYQTGFFKFIVMVVAMIIAVYTGQKWLIGAAAAIGGGTVVFLIYLLKTVLFSYLINTGFKLLAEKIGPEFTMILAVIAFIVSKRLSPSMYQGPGMGAAVVSTPSLTAQLFLSASSALLRGTNYAIEDMVQDITNQYEIFQIDSEEKTKKLEAAKELLQIDYILSFDLLETQQARHQPVEYEEPSAFYDRTIHVGNIGTLVLDIIPNYCDLSLELPEPNITYF